MNGSAGFLLDTNVVSELRKGRRADRGVVTWIGDAPEALHLSVLVVGELRRGVERVRRRDERAAGALEHWLHRVVAGFADRVLPVSRAVADAWGRMGVSDPVPVVDGLLAATAQVHGLTLVTRNVADVAATGVPTLNPFAADG